MCVLLSECLNVKFKCLDLILLRTVSSHLADILKLRWSEERLGEHSVMYVDFLEGDTQNRIYQPARDVRRLAQMIEVSLNKNFP